MDLTALKIEYPELPVVQKREEFFKLLEKHQVVIVKADTGSGKSTQLPKFLLEYLITKGGDFKIGVTEPRRLAAMSIADRLREELKADELVSTKIRFWEQGTNDAPVKVMTDGILLQEFRRDRLFKQYSAIVIDEAHERSLNIDILLGIFKSVLKARPEFKLIVASATLDAALFEKFYDNSCVLEAEGRTFPVEVEYYFRDAVQKSKPRDSFRGPWDDDDDDRRDASGKGDSGLIEEARDAILDLESRHRDHLLCFLPTERDIQDLANELKPDLDAASFDILPLYGRMSPDEQRRIFKSTSKTRVVLATNIAETSLTIPGIAYVVDTGMARISRYNAQSRIQGLPVEEVSKASARQRTGRAGRVKPGVCIRLYSPENFEKRDDFTEPEIRRSNLANVVLQLRSLGLEMESFPFLQAPPHSAFRGAYKTLFELGALTADNASGHVTKLGRDMTKLPMDVALSAVLLRARDAGVLQPALIVCAALSIQDPRVVPNEEPERGRVRGLHRKFAGHKSDFITYVCMWNAFCEAWDTDQKSWNKLRKFCDKMSLHFLRCREWIDLYEQFGRILDAKFESRICPPDKFHQDNLHIALLSGFLGGIARRDIENGCYRLVSGRETHVFPGSDLYGKSVEWLFSAEVRETSRIFLTKGAEIKPEWIMQVAEPFCTRRWYAPVWNKERGFVEAVEEVTFRGLVISRGHRVDYARVNPEECCQIFWREAVVVGEMARPFPFMVHNERVVEDLHALEARKRQFGLAPSEDALVDYYVRIAPKVNSIRTLKKYLEESGDQWLKFDAKFWLDQLDEKMGVALQSSGDRSLGKFGDLLDGALKGRGNDPRAARKHEEKPQAELGGSVEQFRIMELTRGKERVVTGEMVFDATKDCDGITLRFPYDLLTETSPATLALSIHQWREWMVESIVREMPKSAKKYLEGRRTQIDDAFCEKLVNNPHKAPLLCLYEALAEIKQLDCDIPTVTPERENHLRLHLKVFKQGVEEKFPLELSPEWGSYRLFLAVRPVVVTFGIDFPLENLRFGWRLGESALMAPEESTFWQDFRKRLERGSTANSGTGSAAGAADLVADRLNMLETGGLYSDGFKTALKIWVAKSLNADGLDANRCTRFTGLEFSRGKKISDFRNLANTTRSEDEEIRLALVRGTYEAGLLGGNAFVKAWDILKNFSVAMRQGHDHAVDAAGFVVNKIAALYQQDNALFDRVLALGNLLDHSLDQKVSGTRRDVHPIDSAGTPARELDARALRDLFRPYLKARFMKDHELKAARDLLSQIERKNSDDAEFPELFLQAKAMLEDFEIVRFKRKGDDSEEVVEVDALAKLKGRFGRL